ncbi:MAG: Gfo/Idh/MocA family oxidoreductase [Ruminococcaceae bacterium]|nr:Gfo/Idh/MocA family oxidoreductase [Oscillospiraceae bacterium]
MKILLVGASGYATGYVKTLIEMSDPDIVWEGIVDPYYSVCTNKNEIDAKGIPVYDTMDEFYEHHSADLAIICTPPLLHKEQSICALSHGSFVLCEKPVAPTFDDAKEMLDAEKRYGKWIAIGYQWSFSDAIQDLKSDILSGRFGKPQSLKTAVSWPRSLDYYGRSTKWGGRISKNGTLVLDSIASNACAHYLHNMLFVLGESMDKSADISELCGQCFRANDIENFDTCVFKITTDKDVPLYFIASHATKDQRDPEFVYSFEAAKVIYTQSDSPDVIAVFNNGEEICYGNPFKETFKKIFDCIDAVKNNTTPICTVETAMPHAKIIQRTYNEIPITEFPKELVCFNEAENRIFVQGLFEKIYEAYASESMLSYNI